MMKPKNPIDRAINGYVRADGQVGVRNTLLIVSMIDLANGICVRVADAIPGAAALLTPAGGLSFGREAKLIRLLRARLCANPNVGAVMIVGADAAGIERLETDLRPLGKPVRSVSLIEAIDQRRAVAQGIRLGRALARMLASERRRPVALSSLRVGLKSSTSSRESTTLVNPQVGRLTDFIVGAGGAVVATEIADLCGAADMLIGRAATGQTARALRSAFARADKVLTRLDRGAPDPTPMNKAGGLKSLAQKSRGAMKRFGRAKVQSVIGYGRPVPGAGFHFMDGPGSSAVSILGLAAAGCTLIVNTVGLSAAAAASPIVPLIKAGGPLFANSRGADIAFADADDQGARALIDLVLRAVSGKQTASERSDPPHVMMPASLPQL